MKKIIFGLSFVFACSILPVKANSCNEGWGRPVTSCAYIDNDGCSHIVTFHSMLWGLIEWNTDEVVSCA